MDRNAHNAHNARTPRFTLCSAMVAALLAGCTGQTPLAGAGNAPTAGAQPGDDVGAAADEAVVRAEGRVAKTPRAAAARSALAQAYLAAGRFGAAATTFEDAVALGDRSPRTGLGLALSYVGAERNAEALDVLGRWRRALPASDYGLAVALAGRPAEAVAVLSDAVRAGENTPKLRQNLAYAYALDGRWAEARVIASQDVPPDQLDARMGEWAARARPGLGQARVASLIGAPLRADPGQPVALALAGFDHAPRTALAAPVAELPAAGAGAPAPGEEPEPAPQPAAVPPVRSAIERAFAEGIAAHAAPRREQAGEQAGEQTGQQKERQAGQQTGERGAHLVQLESFTTREGAQRAWGIYQRRNPALRGHALRITEAEVHGRRYFRVAAEGFARGAAESMCSRVRQSGGDCFAYQSGRPAPGTVGAGRRGRLAGR
ncbi:tetratricopeptide repeat protein [Novosphingobium soli]|uniref:Tetratricopeptide repeat protein n=1 Tax=Novosphingobium soli TaxID=574956 RepID=A0ABV6CU38_9SPHN